MTLLNVEMIKNPQETIHVVNAFAKDIFYNGAYLRLATNMLRNSRTDTLDTNILHIYLP